MAFRTKTTGIDKLTDYTYEGKQIVLTQQVGGAKKNTLYAKNWFPQEKRLEAATMYAVLRDFEKVSEIVGIPVRILKQYTVQPWWDNIVSKVIKEANEELDGKITQALDKGLDVLLDRIQNGEIWVDRKTGEHRRVPIAAKTVVLATDVLFDKRQLLRGEATTRSDSISPEQKLLALKEQFEKLAKSKGINPEAEIIEGEVVDAKLEELQTGLRTGTESGESGAQEATGTPESSTASSDERREGQGG